MQANVKIYGLRMASAACRSAAGEPGCHYKSLKCEVRNFMIGFVSHFKLLSSPFLNGTGWDGRAINTGKFKVFNDCRFWLSTVSVGG
jgi:hypothetical protein